MSNQNILKELLETLLPKDLIDSAEPLSKLLIDVSSGIISVDDYKKHVDCSPTLQYALANLLGKSIIIDNRVVTVGENGQLGDAPVHDVAGRDIVKPTISNLTVGISYSDARQIAQDVFEANFYRLAGVAQDVARQRASEVADKFLGVLAQLNPSALNSATDPDMQYALYNVQKEYARSGDKDLEEILVDILIDRAGLTERNLKQIVLNEALEVAPKLPPYLYDTLSLIFLFRYTRNLQVNTLDLFIEYLQRNLDAFKDGIRPEASAYQHLEYAGCGTVQVLQITIEEILNKHYAGLFWKDVPEAEIINLQSQNLLFPGLIIRSFHNPNNFQFAAMDEDSLRTMALQNNISSDKLNELINYHNQHLMAPNEIKETLVRKSPSTSVLLDTWAQSSMKNFSLTSVGIAIAHANIRRKTKENIDLGIWIK